MTPKIFFTSLFVFLVVGSLVLYRLMTPSKSITPTQKHEVTQVQLPHNQLITNGSRQKPLVALTFDADMTPGMKAKLKSGEVKSWYNTQVIETLENTHTPATLFLTGMWIEVYPDVAKTLANNPLFELGNHSYSHPGFTPNCYKLTPISNSQDDNEIKKTQELLRGLTGRDNQLFRFPGGCFDKEDLQTIFAQNLVPIQWDVASGDAFNQNTDQIIRNVLNHTQNGSIIVFHLHGGPNAPQTARALPGIITGLRQKGFTFVNVSTLLTELK